MSMKGSSVKRIRLSCTKRVAFSSLYQMLFCACSLFLNASGCLPHTTHTKSNTFYQWQIRRSLIDALCSLYGIQLEEWTCQHWGNKFQSHGRRYLPPITSFGKSKPKRSFAFAGKCEEFSFRPVSQTVNNHIFYQVPVSNSSELSAEVINYLSLIYQGYDIFVALTFSFQAYQFLLRCK